jgi:hypothetical protein
MVGFRTLFARRAPAAALGVAAALLVSGCVERKMILRSDPPGAVAYVDDERVGVTPCEAPFDHYGTRRVTLEYSREPFLKANGGTAPPRFEGGFKRLEADANLAVPWYQWYGLDLITEIAIPFTIRDVQEFVYALEPAEPLPSKEAVLRRAHALRELMERRNEEDRRSRGAEPVPVVPGPSGAVPQ